MTNPELRLRVLKRDNYTCQICHRNDVKLQVHHIVPGSKGGLDGLQNLRAICSNCHNIEHQYDGIERGTLRMVWNQFDRVFPANNTQSTY